MYLIYLSPFKFQFNLLVLFPSGSRNSMGLTRGEKLNKVNKGREVVKKKRKILEGQKL